MHHTAGRKKEQALEKRMGHEMEDAGRIGPCADADKHVAELAHGRIGQDPLDVILRNPMVAAKRAVSSPMIMTISIVTGARI